ncbi:hypothetical protein [Oerskovia enterophila]|uniref:hypothetical protein n=1 Tax=Oerskovia enterophila TaxID=43678 RepID=UPI0033919BEA
MTPNAPTKTEVRVRTRRTVAGWCAGGVLLLVGALPAMYFYILGRESQSRYCNSEVFVRSVCDLAPERFAWVAALLVAPLLIGLLIARPRGVRIYVAVVTLAAFGLFALLLATGDPDRPVTELHPRELGDGRADIARRPSSATVEDRGAAGLPVPPPG